MVEDMERRIRQAEARAELAAFLAVLAVAEAYRPKRRKSIGDRLWDLI